MTKRKLIYFATEAEARSSLACVGAILQPSGLYSFSQGIILVGGIGLLAAANTVARQIAEVDEVWNLGIAGSLREDLAIGEALTIASVRRFSHQPLDLDAHSRRFHQRISPVLTLGGHGMRLTTSDYPIHHTALRQTLAQEADLVDMEGYAIAYTCQAAGKPCVMWKVVSDFASPGGPQLIQQQLASASDKLAKLLSKLCAGN